MATFLKAAKKTDVKQFLSDAAGGNSIRYRVESGKKHWIYIPYLTTEEDNGEITKEIIAMGAEIHEWNGTDDRYNATICAKGTVRKDEEGLVLNDGTCPICERTADAWKVYNFRLELEEKTCGKTGGELIKHIDDIKSKLADERKAKDAKPYMYLLVAVIKTDDGKTPKLSPEGIPEFELKVMKLSASRVEKIKSQLENNMVELEGAELLFAYPQNDDIRQVAGNASISVVFTERKATAGNELLVNKINEAVDKFQWEGIEKAFPEWEGMTTEKAKDTMDSLFSKWDEYVANPNVPYLEYNKAGSATNPSLAGQVSGAAQLPNSGMQMPNAGMQMPNAGMAMPNAGMQMPNVNEIFNGAGSNDI